MSNIIDDIRQDWNSRKENHKNFKSEIIYKMNSLKDTFKGRKAVIITCGPSMKKVSTTAMQSLIDKGYVIVCVKQSIDDMPNKFAHFHVYNFCNEKKYSYNKKVCDTISLYCQCPKKLERKQNTDIVISHIPHDEKDNILTAMMKGRDEMSFDKIISRSDLQVKWGDTMYELAIPLCIQIGVSEIYIIGWDCKNFSERFYKNNKKEKRNAKRKRLDKLQLDASKHLGPFMKNKYDIVLKLVGKPDTSALDIDSVETASLI